MAVKKCPFCAEEIQDAAIKCRYCGSLLNQPSAPTPPDEFADVRELARHNKINAIKLLRKKRPGLGLKEAKDFVEADCYPAGALRPATPSRTQAPTSVLEPTAGATPTKPAQVAGAPAAPHAALKCPHCGHVQEMKSATCWICGKSMVGAASTKQASTRPATWTPLILACLGLAAVMVAVGANLAGGWATLKQQHAREEAALRTTALQGFEASAFCKQYGCLLGETWYLKTGGTNHSYKLNLDKEIVVEVPTASDDRIESYGISFYGERGRLGDPEIGVVDNLLTTIDAGAATVAVQQFVRANVDRPVSQIRLAESIAFGQYRLWAGKVANNQIVEIASAAAVAEEQHAAEAAVADLTERQRIADAAFAKFKASADSERKVNEGRVPGTLKSADSPAREDTHLQATVDFDGTRFDIKNLGALDWTNVKCDLNGGILSSGYVYRLDSLPAMSAHRVGAMQFANSSGTRFDPFETKPMQMAITATLPSGSTGVRIVTWR